MSNKIQANNSYYDLQCELRSNDNYLLSEQQNSWIQSFLSAQTLINNKKQQNQVSQIQQTEIIQNNSIANQNCQTNIIPVCQNKRSVFHNFQKHLNVLLKKMTLFKKKSVQKTQQGHIAHRIWNLFLETHSYNKKTLRIIFGFPGDISNQEIVREMVNQFPHLKCLYQDFSAQLIVKAQKFIRSCIVENSKHINLNNLQSKTKITNQLEKFYQYFKNFIDELEQGQPNMRISKKNKNKILKNISHPRKLQINQ